MFSEKFLVENTDKKNIKDPQFYHSEFTVVDIWARLRSMIFVFCGWPHHIETQLCFFNDSFLNISSYFKICFQNIVVMSIDYFIVEVT